jgi:hypothetical protein
MKHWVHTCTHVCQKTNVQSLRRVFALLFEHSRLYVLKDQRLPAWCTAVRAAVGKAVVTIQAGAACGVSVMSL